MSRNAQNPEDEEPLLPPLTISQTLTRVSLLACLGVGTIMFLKSQMVARRHLARTSKVAETIANCHQKATDRLIRENERGVQRIVDVLRENQMRGGGGTRDVGESGNAPLWGAVGRKAEGVRFDDEYGKWNGYTRTEGGHTGGADRAKMEGVRFEDMYRHIGTGGGVDGMRFKDKYPYGLGKQDRKAEGVRFQDHYLP